MPITVLDIKGVPGNRRERLEAAVVAGGTHAGGPYEAWIAADPFKGGFRVHRVSSGLWCLLWTTIPAEIAERVRETLED